MKHVLIVSSLAYTSFAFSSNNFEDTVKNIILNYDIIENINIDQLTCGISECRGDIIENNILTSSITFREESNNDNGALKTIISVENKINYEITEAVIVCLASGECKSFTSDQLKSADYSFHNGKFAKERNKRTASLSNYSDACSSSTGCVNTVFAADTTSYNQLSHLNSIIGTNHVASHFGYFQGFFYNVVILLLTRQNTPK